MKTKTYTLQIEASTADGKPGPVNRWRAIVTFADGRKSALPRCYSEEDAFHDGVRHLKDGVR